MSVYAYEVGITVNETTVFYIKETFSLVEGKQLAFYVTGLGNNRTLQT